MHFDNGHNNLFFVKEGQKKVILFPPNTFLFEDKNKANNENEMNNNVNISNISIFPNHPDNTTNYLELDSLLISDFDSSIKELSIDELLNLKK